MLAITEPVSLTWDGIPGERFWCRHPVGLTGDVLTDESLAGFPLIVFRPPHRPPAETPLVIALQGMCAPCQWNAFLAGTLTRMGIAVALFETPLAAERSLVRTFRGQVSEEIGALLMRGVPLTSQTLVNFFQAVVQEVQQVRDFCRERYQLTDPRLALFGVSMGVLLTSLAFTSAGVGERLLGCIGHADLAEFATSWGLPLLPELAASPLGRVAELALRSFRPQLQPVVSVLRLVKELKRGSELTRTCDPLTYVDRVEPHRRVRFLVGEKDALVRVEHARRCAARFPDGECYVVPALAHGHSLTGPTFVEHMQYFLGTQLGDWQSAR